MTLRSRDLRAVLAFVADAYDADGPHALSNELLDGLTELVGCEYAMYETYDWPRRVVTAEVNCSNDPQAESPPYVSDGFWEGECRAFFTGATSDKMSDRFRRRERERLFKHAEHFDGFRIVDRLGVSVGDPRTRSAWLGFDSERRDFDERDRELALTLRPHLDALWRRATSRARVADLIAAIEGDGDAGGDQAIVLLDADGRIDHASAEAHRLLAAWFGARNGRLPSELHKWFVLAGPGDLCIERRNGSILTVAATGDFTLTLRERVSDDAYLTPREREVLGLVADGLTNARSRAGSGSRSRRSRSTSSRRIRSSAFIAVRRPSRGSRSCRTSRNAVTRSGKRFRVASSGRGAAPGWCLRGDFEPRGDTKLLHEPAFAPLDRHVATRH